MNGTPSKMEKAPNSHKKIWWKCLVCDHEWSARVASRNSGSGCPACTGQVTTKHNCLAIKNKKLANEWHQIKNGRLTPYDVMPGSRKKVWWKCPICDHRWEAYIWGRNKGHGCPACSGRVSTKQNNLAKKNKKLSDEWHPTKNGKLTSRDVLPSSNKRAWWRCSKCDHEWESVIANRSNGNCCPACSGQVATKQNNLSVKNKKLANEWHPIKNGKLTPCDVMPGSGKKVWWKCVKCYYEWESIIGSRNNGNGCPACSGRVATKYNCLAAKNKELAKEWHPTKNGKLIPYNVTQSSGKKVWWECSECDHEWEAVIAGRSNGSGCPACSGRVINELVDTTRTRLSNYLGVSKESMCNVFRN